MRGLVLSGFGLGCWVVGFVVRRRLAGFWVLQSVRQGFPGVSWAILAGIGAAPAGPGPPSWLGEAVLRPKAARLAFVVVVCVWFVCSWVWVCWVACLICAFCIIAYKYRISI